jgi:hypothetical protein
MAYGQGGGLNIVLDLLSVGQVWRTLAPPAVGLEQLGQGFGLDNGVKIHNQPCGDLEVKRVLVIFWVDGGLCRRIGGGNMRTTA